MLKSSNRIKFILAQINSYSFMEASKSTLFDLKFQNIIYKSFEIEQNPFNEPHKVSGYLYSRVYPTPLKSPLLISLSPSALSLLNLNSIETLINSHKTLNPSLEEILSGNQLLPDSKPIAHNYSGYQFGQFAGQLGDGRAITLGDIINEKGEILELQLKGSGLTPYSRFADGRAVLRSTIREFLCSEAMFHLGIPTTRALSIVKGEDTVMRDLLYDGHAKEEKCAIVLRIAPSFVRFGSFEFMLNERKEGNINDKEVEIMSKLLDFLINNHYKEIKSKGKEKIIEFYKEIVKRTAKLVALWQCYGFCHGVLNTDNMSIIGLTIDYGPYGFLDYYNAGHICNHSDTGGRYSYENQPMICKWNLARLAEALSVLHPLEDLMGILKNEYDKAYQGFYLGKMREKLGLFALEKNEDEELMKSFFDILNLSKLDFTNCFRKLADFDEFNEEKGYLNKFAKSLCDLAPQEDIFNDFFKTPITEQQLLELKKIMEVQPRVAIMLGYTQEIVEKYEKKINEWKQIKNENHEERMANFTKKIEDWLKNYKIRILEEHQFVKQNSKENDKVIKTQKRKEFMNAINPAFILRNYLLEECIKKAENGDYSEITKLLNLAQNPFKEIEKTEYCSKVSSSGTKICVSCSS